MFQITRRADYALRIMLELGSRSDGVPIPTHEIAEYADVPIAFMRKIVADLARANLLQTLKGPQGGLTLNRPLGSINMLQIVEAVEGPVYVNICIQDPEECERQPVCPGFGFWKRLQADIVNRLSNATLDTFVEEAAALKERRLPVPAG